MRVGNTLDEILAAACTRITRHTPAEAAAAQADGALIVDIRSTSDRERDGIVPDSLHLPRTVLEWRASPDGCHRNPYLGDLDDRVILICDHGCSSILAAASLVDLGYTDAGDVVGGFAAWRDAGLPMSKTPPRPDSSGELPGMGPPDS